MAPIVRILSLGLLLSAAAATAQDSTLTRALEMQLQRVEAHPDDARVLSDYGSLLATAGRDEQAEEYFRAALTLDPDSEVARYNLGLLLHRLERQEEATDVFLDVLARNPRHAASHYQLGSILEAKGARKKATRHYVEAFSNDLRLTFSDLNPQIIDSRLTTVALLKAYAGKSRVVLAPFDYAQPVEVAAMMVESATPEEPLPDDDEELEDVLVKPQEDERGDGFEDEGDG